MTSIDFTKLVQRRLNVSADGIVGPKTLAALDQALPPNSTPDEAVGGAEPPVDERSEKNIATLHPRLRDKARALVRLSANQGITIKVISGTRSYEEQAALYAKGRTAPGPKVTNAKPGDSWHQHSVAWDIGVWENGTYVGDSPKYRQVGEIGESLGLEWGGRWKFVDLPHFQDTGGKTIAQAKALHAQGKSVLD